VQGGAVLVEELVDDALESTDLTSCGSVLVGQRDEP
jgi:hypothetical protein